MIKLEDLETPKLVKDAYVRHRTNNANDGAAMWSAWYEFNDQIVLLVEQYVDCYDDDLMVTKFNTACTAVYEILTRIKNQ